MGPDIGRGIAGAFVTLFVVAGLGLLYFVVTLGIWAFSPSELDWQTEAIARGFALYCPSSGEFAWQGECAE
jgi:hypothetical protein